MRRRILISILLVIAATVLTLGVPLAIVSWRLVDDLLHQELSGRLQSMESSISLRDDETSQIDLTALRVAIPEGGRLEIHQAGVPSRGIGAAPSSDVYSGTVALPGGGQLVLSLPMDRLRAERWKALSARRRGRPAVDPGGHGHCARPGPAAGDPAQRRGQAGCPTGLGRLPHVPPAIRHRRT